MKARIIISTVENREDGVRIVQSLLQDRLIACGTLLPKGLSIYRWKEEIEREEEYLLVLKTVDEKLEELKTRYQREHPFDVPEFLIFTPSEVSDDYLEWLEGCTS